MPKYASAKLRRELTQLQKQILKNQKQLKETRACLHAKLRRSKTPKTKKKIVSKLLRRKPVRTSSAIKYPKTWMAPKHLPSDFQHQTLKGADGFMWESVKYPNSEEYYWLSERKNRTEIADPHWLKSQSK